MEATGDKQPSVALLAYPLTPDGIQDEPQILFNQPTLASCEADNIFVSSNAHVLILQYNCEADQFIYLLDLQLTPPKVTTIQRGYFLNWSPDGEWFLFRYIDQDNVWLMPASGEDGYRLDLPVGTYGATFTVDGQNVIYQASPGLEMGSELGALSLTDGSLATWQKFPHQTIAYPQWSPDGSQLAYILMPDTNIPYTIGELWLADRLGNLVTFVGDADAGHGYPPVWSSNGKTVSYIYRENFDSLLADYHPNHLHSNIYQVDVNTREVASLTQFSEKMVYDLVWSPDGSQLAFTVNDAVWLLESGQEPVQINSGGITRHPAWITLPTP